VLFFFFSFFLRTAGRAEHHREEYSCSSASVALTRNKAVGTKADPIMLEVFKNMFMSMPAQMGSCRCRTRLFVKSSAALELLLAGSRPTGCSFCQRAAHPVHLG